MKRYIRSTTNTDPEVFWPNGKQLTADECIEVLMWYYGEDAKEARNDLFAIKLDKLQDAVDYYVEKTDGPITSSSKPDWLVDFKIPDYESESARKARIQRELDDEADAYDLEHGEGIYSDDVDVVEGSLFGNKKRKSSNDQLADMIKQRQAQIDEWDKFDKDIRDKANKMNSR